jgi:hypothetical protein
MMVKIKKLTLIISWVLLGTTVQSQQTDFSGTWEFDDQQVISGDVISDVSPSKMTITQTNDGISIEKMTSAGNGDVVTHETVAFGGKPFQMTTASGGKKWITIRWSPDQKSFSETTDLFSPSDSSKLEYKVTDTWSRDEGKLVLLRRDENLILGKVQESKLFYFRH